MRGGCCACVQRVCRLRKIRHERRGGRGERDAKNTHLTHRDAGSAMSVCVHEGGQWEIRLSFTLGNGQRETECKALKHETRNGDTHV